MRNGGRIAMDVKSGDRILFGKMVGHRGSPSMATELLIMKESDILGVIGQSSAAAAA